MYIMNTLENNEKVFPRGFQKKSWAFLGMHPLRELIRPNLCVCMCVRPPVGPRINIKNRAVGRFGWTEEHLKFDWTEAAQLFAK